MISGHFGLQLDSGLFWGLGPVWACGPCNFVPLSLDVPHGGGSSVLIPPEDSISSVDYPWLCSLTRKVRKTFSGLTQWIPLVLMLL